MKLCLSGWELALPKWKNKGSLETYVKKYGGTETKVAGGREVFEGTGHAEAFNSRRYTCVQMWKAFTVAFQLCGSVRQRTTCQVTQIDPGEI